MPNKNEELTYQEWDWLRFKAEFQREKFEIEQCYGVDYHTYLAQSRSQKNSAIDYQKYPAQPTRYNGQFFRSQLEATWAAFFDKVAQSWEYEPTDAENFFWGWQPDFKILIHQTPVYCEVKPLWIGTFPDWLATKILDAESASQSRPNNNIKLAILGNAAPLAIENISSLGYISLRRRDHQRNWLPFSVGNKFAIHQIWQEAQQKVQAQPGFTPIPDCLADSFVKPVENLFPQTDNLIS